MGLPKVTAVHSSSLQLEPYKFSGPITIGPDDESPPVTQPYSLIFMGTGSGSLSKPLLQMVTNSLDLFVVNNNTSQDENVGGVVFQDMQIAYASNLTAGAAIKVINSQNVRVLRVLFSRLPSRGRIPECLAGIRS